MSPSADQRHKAVEAATAIFWRHGYADASMAEIVAATGLNRYALYSIFGSKRDLFIAALDAYFEIGREKFEPLLTDEAIPPLERIARCLQGFVEMALETENGCFICHVAVEHCDSDTVVRDACEGYFAEIKKHLQVPLCQAQAEGSLNPNLTVEQAAQLVFDAEMSMGVHVRARAKSDVYARIIGTTLAALAAPAAGPGTQQLTITTSS